MFAASVILLVLIQSGLTQGSEMRRQLLANLNFDGPLCLLGANDACVPNPDVVQIVKDNGIVTQAQEGQCTVLGIDSDGCSEVPDCKVVPNSGGSLDEQFSDFGLCVHTPVADQTVALEGILGVYDELVSLLAHDQDNIWFQTAQCALVQEGCADTEGCIEIDEFPPHCRVNSPNDPIDNLVSNILSSHEFSTPITTTTGSDRITLAAIEAILFCAYEQLYVLRNPAFGGTYEKCQAGKLFDPSFYFDASIYLGLQECIISTPEDCQSQTATIVQNSNEFTVSFRPAENVTVSQPIVEVVEEDTAAQEIASSEPEIEVTVKEIAEEDIALMAPVVDESAPMESTAPLVEEDTAAQEIASSEPEIEVAVKEIAEEDIALMAPIVDESAPMEPTAPLVEPTSEVVETEVAPAVAVQAEEVVEETVPTEASSEQKSVMQEQNPNRKNDASALSALFLPAFLGAVSLFFLMVN